MLAIAVLARSHVELPAPASGPAPHPKSEAVASEDQVRDREQTATGARLASEADLPPAPTALERFRKVLEGPTEPSEFPPGRPVPRPATTILQPEPPPTTDPAAPADGNTPPE